MNITTLEAIMNTVTGGMNFDAVLEVVRSYVDEDQIEAYPTFYGTYGFIMIGKLCGLNLTLNFNEDLLLEEATIFNHLDVQKSKEWD